MLIVLNASTPVEDNMSSVVSLQISLCLQKQVQALDLYCRGNYIRGRIVEVSRHPSRKCYGGLSPEWPRRDSLCSFVVVDIHFVLSMSVVLLV